MKAEELKTLKDFEKMMKEMEPFLRKPENFDSVFQSGQNWSLGPNNSSACFPWITFL